MRSLFRRYSDQRDEPPKDQPPITISRRQLRTVIGLIVVNVIVLIALALIAFSALNQPPITIVQMVTQPPALPTRVIPATPAPTATPEPPSPFGGGGTIGFTLRRNGNSDIYAVNAGDNQLIRLVDNPADDRDAAFSPDGRQIAFASHRDGNWEIYRMVISTGVTSRLTFSTTYEGAPAWSPDGKSIVFESYRNNNLDIYTMSQSGGSVKRLTTNVAPDTNPAWSPDGKFIAYASYRDGNKDIYLIPLDSIEGDTDAANLTNTPDRDEDNPAWSPDGNQLAYTSSGRTGDQLIYLNTFDLQFKSLQEADVGLFGQGTEPTWSPDGNALAFTYHKGDSDVLIGANTGGWGLAQPAFGGREFIEHPTWTANLIPTEAISRSLAAAPLQAPPLYTEVVSPTAPGLPPYVFVQLENITPRGMILSDAVDDSFRALRARILRESGIDFLANLGDSWRPMNHIPRDGQSRRSYHVTGRAIDIDQEPYTQPGNTIVFVREDIGSITYWHVYIKTKNQDGTQGEPLREAPWNLQTGTDSGGAPLTVIPTGYYLDFTTIAADYGWHRVRAIYRWRSYYPDTEWWHFQKTDDLSWWDAMKQVYKEDDIIASYGPYPGRDN